MAGAAEQVTQILEAVGGGDAQAAEKLLPLIDEELPRLGAEIPTFVEGILYPSISPPA